MARGLIAALAHIGAQIDQPSQLRSRDGAGDGAAQSAIQDAALAEIATTLSHPNAAQWRAWVTYHNYYKAPDLIGPAVSSALNIPYLAIESTRATKRLKGPWAGFAKAAEAASDAADVILYLTERDAEALRRGAPKGQHLLHLAPFLATTELPRVTRGNGPMLSVGMMRYPDKLASYTIIGKTLSHLPGDWHLNIAGDGPARADVVALMQPFGNRVTFLGACDRDAMSAAYADATVMFWPGVNEAFGLAYIEAQAHGIPIVAQDRPGVSDVLVPSDYPLPDAGAKPLAKVAHRLLSDAVHWQKASTNARAHVAQNHLLPAAADTLRQGLTLAGAL